MNLQKLNKFVKYHKPEVGMSVWPKDRSGPYMTKLVVDFISDDAIVFRGERAGKECYLEIQKRCDEQAFNNICEIISRMEELAEHLAGYPGIDINFPG